MKLIIAGSRTFEDYDLLKTTIDALDLDITEIVSGKAKGADTLGEAYAKEYGIPLKEFPADWKTYGRKAGALRNIQMKDYADSLVAFHLNNSRGTQHMIRIMQEAKKPTFVVKI